MSLSILSFFMNDSQRLYRYLFMEFKDPDEATYALGAMQGFPFDKRHTFVINRFSDIERFASMDPIYVEPEPEEYKPRVGFLSSQVLSYLYIFIGTSSSVARRRSGT